MVRSYCLCAAIESGPGQLSDRSLMAACCAASCTMQQKQATRKQCRASYRKLESAQKLWCVSRERFCWIELVGSLRCVPLLLVLSNLSHEGVTARWRSQTTNQAQIKDPLTFMSPFYLFWFQKASCWLATACL